MFITIFINIYPNIEEYPEIYQSLTFLLAPSLNFERLFMFVMGTGFQRLYSLDLQGECIIFLTDIMRQSIDLSKDREGELYEQQAALESRLNWSNLESDVLIRGISERTALSNIRNTILALQEKFTSENGPRIVLEGNQIDDFHKRFLLIENQIEGLMKRRIEYSSEDQASGQRFLDYSTLLNEKQNQVVQLEKKINNLEERLRRASARQLELENEIVLLNQKLIVKEGIINTKNQVILSEVAATNSMRDAITRLKRNLEINKSKISPQISGLVLDGVVIPDIGSFDIRGDALIKQGAQGRSQNYSQSSDGQRLKTKVIQMFREFERLFQQNQQLTKEQIERIIEGFLIELQGTRLYESVQVSIHRQNIQQEIRRLRQNFAVAAGIYQTGLQQLRNDNPGIRINLEKNLFDILQREKVQAYKTQGGAIFINDFSQKTVQVPVQDARTKHLLHLFASELKRLFTKYPKLHGELDERIIQFFQQEIIDYIEVDEIDRIVQIVKYQPQVVKVENVYAYSSEKSRKVEFHLRVLIKALLEQMEKLKVKSGIVPQMDEGVMAMIRQQIMGVVDVDDILKVFKVVPKIVEVQKVVEKIVEKLVEVPKTITVDRIVEKVVEIEKIKQVEKKVNVPLQQPMIVDRTIDKVIPLTNTIEKVVEVPVIVQKIIEVVKQVPKIQEVERFQEKVVEVDKVVEVQRVVNHIEKQIHEIEVIHQKVVPTQKIVEKIVEVPVIVEKIVEKIVEIPKVIEVEKIVEKCVPVVEYINAREVQNHIEVQHNIVERIVEKPVPIIQTVQRIVQVPQIVEKIVEIEHTETQIVEKQVIVEKIVIEQKIKQVEKIVTQTIEVIKEVPVEIERFIEIPIIHQKIKIVQEFIEKPCIERVVETIIQEVYLREPLVVKDPKIVEVQKMVYHYIEVPKPVKYIEQKIVQVEKKVDRIKQVRVEIDKLVQKMVEVPKVVEVEKIVQKVVVVPRIVERVIEVPQIVEKVVEKQIIKQVLKEVERKVEVPVFQDRVQEIEIQKNIFIEVEKVVDRIVDKLVEVPKFEQVVQIKEIIQEKIIEVVKEVPVQLETEKIVTLYADNVKLIEIERPIIVPAEIPVPVDRIVQKLVLKEDIKQKIVTVPQVIEKVVAIKEQEVVIQEIEKLIQKVVVDTKIKEVEKIVPYIQEVIKQVPTIVEKIVQVNQRVEEIVTTQQIVEKIVEKTITVPKIYEVERIKEKMVEVPQFLEIQKIVPQLVRVNNYIQNVVEKIVQVPIIMEQLKEVEREVQKVVKVENQYEKVVEVEKNIEKIVIMEKLKEVVRDVNYIEQVLHIVQRLEQIPAEIVVKEEVLVEVPYILEKIVEKIVVMPQIVEVLKYVHEVCETEELGVAVGVEASVHEQRYKQLSRDMKGQLDILLRQLRGLKQGNPKFKETIEMIERFLGEFEKYVMTPRIVKTVEEKVVDRPVEVQKIVKIPTDNERSMRMELSLSLLVEKLILELKRVQSTGAKLQLDEDIKLIFFSDLNTRSQLQGQMAAQFESYSSKIMRQFESLGSWSLDHQFMLNSFLQQRFMMAQIVHDANLKIDQANQTSQKRLQALRKYKKDRSQFAVLLTQIGNQLQGCEGEVRDKLGGVFQIISKFNQYDNLEPHVATRQLGELVLDERISSLFREKDEEIYRLRDLIFKFESKGLHQRDNAELQRLRIENAELRSKLSSLESQNVEHNAELILGPIKQQIKYLQDVNLDLESQNSSLISEIINLQAENQVLRQLTGDASSRLSEHQIFSQSPIKRQFIHGTHISNQSKKLVRQGEGSMGSVIQSSVITARGDRGGNLSVTPDAQKGDQTPFSTALKEDPSGKNVRGFDSTPGEWSSSQHGGLNNTPSREQSSSYQQGGNVAQSRQLGYGISQQGQQQNISSSIGSGQGQNLSESRRTGTGQQGQYSQYGQVQQGQGLGQSRRSGSGQYTQYGQVQQGQGLEESRRSGQGQYTQYGQVQQGQGQYTQYGQIPQGQNLGESRRSGQEQLSGSQTRYVAGQGYSQHRQGGNRDGQPQQDRKD